VVIRANVYLLSARFIVIALLAIAVCSILAYTISRITSEPVSSEYVASVATAIEPVRIRVAVDKLEGYLVVADTEELQRRGYELVREGDIGVLFVFKDLPRAVCLRNPFNYTLYVYITTRGTAGLLSAIYVARLEPDTRWCTLVLSGEMLLETSRYLGELALLARR